MGTGATTRLTSLDFSCSAIPNTTISTITQQDFSDAPASYGNPIHDIVTGVRIGATNTAETTPYANPNAAGDAGDDGVTFPVALTQGQMRSATIAVTGANGFLQGWVDWNRNGSFTDAGEQIATNIRDNQPGDANAAAGVTGIAFTVPALATTTQTFARFRWSLQSGINATNIVAPNGEVEDYALTIIGQPVFQMVKESAAVQATGMKKFFIPGSEVTYTIRVTNVGAGAATSDSIFFYDSLPSTLEYFNGDIDPGAAVMPVIFSQTGTAITFTPATDLRYSNLTAAPANFA